MSALHVAIGVLCGTTGGPATYGRQLVRALAATGEARLSVLTDRPDAFGDLDNVEFVELPMRGGLDRLRWQHLAVPKALRRLHADVYHDTKNALPRRLPCRAAVTVHDLAYHTVPESFGFGSRLFLKRATRDAVRRAAAVIVPSEATARDLRRIHPEGADRLHVVPHGIDPAPVLADEQVRDALTRLAIAEPYVLHVGTIQARKNVDLVVAGVRAVRQRNDSYRAVIVGRRGWLSERAFAEIERDDTAIWIEHVSDADLAALYARASAFVSPSAYEGFGFAVADALAAGVPTVIANISSLPELCGDAAVRLPELSSAAVADALADVLATETPHPLCARGKARAAQFSWQHAAEGHLRAYRATQEHGS